jgi:uncharacterized Rmd1/YagE family protein
LFWSEASLYPLYEAIREYLEIGPRVQVLNDRLAVVGDLVRPHQHHQGVKLIKQVEIMHEYLEEQAAHRLTWIVIWLIVAACLVEAVRLLITNLSAIADYVGRGSSSNGLPYDPQESRRLHAGQRRPDACQRR